MSNDKNGNNYFEDQFDEREVNLTDYLNIILRYKFHAIITFIVVMIVASIYTVRQPQIFKGTCKILIEDSMSNDLLFNSFSNKATNLNNNIHILKSRPTLNAAYQLLKSNSEYKKFPISTSDSPLGYLANNMTIDTERETDILIISFESINPLECKEAANALAEGLMQSDTEYARREFRVTREFLANQLDEKDRKLRASEEDLRNFKLENGISMLSEETTVLIEQASELGALLSDAQTELEVAENQLNYLTDELSSQDLLLSDVNSVLSSTLLEGLKREVVENQTTYVKLLTKSNYDPSHPELIALNKSIANAKTKLNEELQRLIMVKKGSADPLIYRSKLIEEISSAQIDQNIGSAKVTSIKNELSKYERRMSVLPDTEIELARLERNFALNEKVYSMLLTNYEDVKIAEKSKIGNIRFVEEAIEPGNPIKPNKKMNLLISLVLGFGLGIGLAILLHSLDTKIRTMDDVKQYISLPVLGTIPFIDAPERDIDEVANRISNSDSDQRVMQELIAKMKGRVVTSYSPKSSASEAFRILRTNVLSKKKENEAMSIMTTSSGPQEGKSTTNSNLAVALAQMEVKVVLVDVDLRRPIIHELFGLEKENGLSDFLFDKESKIEDFFKDTANQNLKVITSGYIPPNPSELLASPRMDKAIADLKKHFDFVLFDSPPIIAVTDSLVLAPKVDLIAIVVRINRVDKLVIKRGIEILENLDLKITGVVINGILPNKYYNSNEYNYYYYYYYGPGNERKKSFPRFARKD